MENLVNNNKNDSWGVQNSSRIFFPTRIRIKWFSQFRTKTTENISISKVRSKIIALTGNTSNGV
jgi:hypothetical protein